MSDLYTHLAAEDEARQLRIAKAMRVLKPGGLLVVCDGDYDTATWQIGDFDPLDQLVRAMIDQNVTKLWVMRQMAHMLTECGFELGKRRGHFYVAEGSASSFSPDIDRGADRLVECSGLFAQSAEALKAEAQSRLKAVTFFGCMSDVSQIAHKPTR